jgi:hypothetical protein
MLKKITLTLILIVLTLSACQSPAEEDQLTREGEPFAIYLLTDEQITGPAARNYDIDKLPLAEMPIIAADDIINYDWERQGFNLEEEAYFRLISIFMGGLPFSGVPFVVMSYQQPIYVGAFWTPYSSLSFDGVVIMQPLDPAGQTIYINLGYPNEDQFTGEDPRSDPRLQQALEEAGLIKD